MMTDEPSPPEMEVYDLVEGESLMLAQVRDFTREMRLHQRRVSELGDRRRDVVRSLRLTRVPYRRIAAAMGVSEQAVYADLRKHPLSEPEAVGEE